MAANDGNRSPGRARRAAPPAYEPIGPALPSWTPLAHPPPSANDAPAPPSEQTPLLPQHNTSHVKGKKCSMIWLTLAVMAFLFVIISREEALDPAARDRIRQAWNREIRAHEVLRRAWSVELADHETIRVGWENERQEIIAMREQLVHDREQWERDREEEKGKEERRRREEEDRVRAGFAWDGLKADQRCLQHGTRQYTARLANVPRAYDPVKACTETAVEINGRKISSPHQCEDRGCSGVFGHWIINYSEPTCITHFNDFIDRGCTSSGSGRRRIDSHLEDLRAGDDWRDMCSTTPANFRHLHFDNPDVCVDWGKNGIWGIWEIEDEACW